MRLSMAMPLALLLATSVARAHGPQIQLTATSDKLVTRELLPDGPYSNSLTLPKRVYVMPLAEYLGMWQSHPNDARLAGGEFEYPSGPGFAFGYGYDAASNPAPFPLGSKFVLGFTDGLKSWTGAAFADAGVAQLNAYRGSSAAPTAQATTTDAGPFQSLMFPGGAGVSFTSAEAHNGVSYRMLGDGTSSTSAVADGLYLVSLQLSSTDAALTASDPFYFLLSKNADASVGSALVVLGFDSGLVQNLVPEPASAGLAAGGLAGLALLRRRSLKARKQLA